jgi:nucleotide-binding universal stress UspA family protein
MHPTLVMTIDSVRRLLMHGGSDEGFDASVRFAGRLAETFGAELHVVYTVDEPLSAGWTAEIAAEKLPELHQAIEAEARERLARLIPGQQETVTIAIRTGDPAVELPRYTAEHTIALAIVHGQAEHARALLAHCHCSVLVLLK